MLKRFSGDANPSGFIVLRTRNMPIFMIFRQKGVINSKYNYAPNHEDMGRIDAMGMRLNQLDQEGGRNAG